MPTISHKIASGATVLEKIETQPYENVQSASARVASSLLNQQEVALPVMALGWALILPSATHRVLHAMDLAGHTIGAKQQLRNSYLPWWHSQKGAIMKLSIFAGETVLLPLVVALSLILLISPTIYAGDINEALIDAAANGDIAQVKNLMAKGASVEAGIAALLMAATTGHRDIVALLAKTKIGTTALMGAAAEGRTDTVRLLLTNGADGTTALMGAAAEGHTDTVRLLLTNGADSTTALLRAAANGHTDIVQVLLANGTDVKARNKEGVTALMGAAGAGHTDTVHVILANGADVKASTVKGATALLWAAIKGHTDTVRVLLANGADAKARDKDGVTALMGAAGACATDTVRVLLANGADAKARDKNGETVIQWAEQAGQETQQKSCTDIVQLLKKAMNEK